MYICKALRTGSLENGDEMLPIVAIGKLRDISCDENAYVMIKQLNSHTYCMPCYIVILDEDVDSAEGVRVVADVVVQSMNTYSRVCRNSMDIFSYHGLVDEKYDEGELHALYH